MKNLSVFNRNTPTSLTYPIALAETLRRVEQPSLAKLRSVIRHPRSLSRPHGSWRPPILTFPAVAACPRFVATVTRHRLGPRALARIKGYDGYRQAAYLIALRFSDPTGHGVDAGMCEAWIRAFVGEEQIESVHEVERGHTATFVWVVDGHFNPVYSPASLFHGFSAAA